jgi:glycosyltransferase involved in cell wall biosynthesis
MYLKERTKYNLKIVILNNDFRVYWKGRLLYLQNFLALQNIDFFAIELFGKGSPYSFDDITSNKNWWTCLFPDKAPEELSDGQIEKVFFSALDELMPDIVITSSIVFNAGALGIRWAKKRKKKFVMFDDAKPAQIKRNFVVQTIKNIITAQADGFWFPSKDYYNAYSYFHNKEIHFFYGFSCIDNSLFKFKGEKKFNHKVIICVARLVPIKNLDNLLRAWQNVEKKMTGYQLVIVGNGPELDHLTKLVSDLQLKNIEFTGFVDNDALNELYFNVDAFILSSFSETWGLVVNEAMAAGLPVLLSNGINAVNTLLVEGENGFSFDPVNLTEITGAILKFINSTPAEKTAMSAKSLAIINEMSYEKMGLQLVDGLKHIEQQKYKRPGLPASLLINKWPGQYNRSGWDKL